MLINSECHFQLKSAKFFKKSKLTLFHASVQKVPNENVFLDSRRCKILVCRYHYRKAWYLIDL
eukprot:UN04689